MKFGEVLAKSNPQETLQEHTIHALHVWRQLRERYYVLMPDEQFWKDSYIAVLFHDFGKNTVNFQMQIRCKGRFPGTYLRHEFIPASFCSLATLITIQSILIVFLRYSRTTRRLRKICSSKLLI